MFSRQLFSIVLLSVLPTLRAEVVLAPLFQDHAVLQRDRALPIWGTADAGEAVTVSLGGHSVRATAGKDGRWLVKLDPLPANANPQELVVKGRANTITVRDVLIGDVWLLSGQSNMEWPVRWSINADAEIAAATDGRIRHFKTTRTIAHPAAPTVSGSWAVASPETAGHFSAIGYFFARDVIREVGVPIGLLNSTWGGTPVESWLPQASLHQYPVRRLAFEHLAKTVVDIARKYGQHERELAGWAARSDGTPKPNEPWTPGPEIAPGVLFNGMVAPHVPAALCGVLWYQGEANGDAPESYEALFTELIRSWRTTFEQPNLPFYWVQLANWNRAHAQATHWARLRDAQTAALALPHTGQAIAIDIGDPDDIHPRNKQEAARRLAAIALAQVYERDVPYRGPTFAGLSRNGSALRVKFEHAQGLRGDDGIVLGFEVAGTDQVFQPAEAVIEGITVRVSAAAVPEPVAVRYAWSNCPVATLRNGAGLPAVPFRSDDWPELP
jgi:sialate O-acetylesterase